MFSPVDHHLTLLGWHLCGHATDRMRERGVRVSQLVAALTCPELTYPQGGDTIYTRGRLAVVVVESSHTVITVLLTGAQRWSLDEARAAFAAS